MKHVAKLVIVDGGGKYLLLRRNNHPVFGNDPDLPGGTLEEGELPMETMIREVSEEIAVTIDQADVRELYASAEYSAIGTHYTLYIAELHHTPDVTISWEHSDYEWLDRQVFLEKVRQSNDKFMHMVFDALQ